MAAQEKIPVYTTLADVYQDIGISLKHAPGWDQLAQTFLERFGRKPEYIARAPGRVNLIGEHVDYALFGVFPAAIEREILIACARRPLSTCDNPSLHAPGSVIAENLNPKYTKQFFTPLLGKSMLASVVAEENGDNQDDPVDWWHIDIDKTQLRWESYIKAGYSGILNHFFPSSDSPSDLPVPVDLLVAGDVPSGAGLSSSAALVVASSLAFLAVNGKLDDEQHRITKGKFVQIAMESERRVGVNTGGMDQAASVMSLPGSALFVSFYPTLDARLVPLPQGAVFVCANSLVVSDKVVHAHTRYNLRVVETLVGARMLARKLGVQLDQGGREKVTLREVIGRWVGEGPEGVSEAELSVALEKIIGELDTLRLSEDTGLGLTMTDMIASSGLEKDEFCYLYLSSVTVKAERFQIYKRVKHVLSEALRVLQFRSICIGADPSSPRNSLLKDLGQLMNESQESCRSTFECSCPELDELTRLANEAGAFGSRLTGAGWGGCTVSLVAESEVRAFIAKIRKSYGPYRGMSDEELSGVIFATHPSSGACVIRTSEW